MVNRVIKANYCLNICITDGIITYNIRNIKM